MGLAVSTSIADVGESTRTAAAAERRPSAAKVLADDDLDLRPRQRRRHCSDRSGRAGLGAWLATAALHSGADVGGGATCALGGAPASDHIVPSADREHHP